MMRATADVHALGPQGGGEGVVGDEVHGGPPEANLLGLFAEGTEVLVFRARTPLTPLLVKPGGSFGVGPRDQ